MSGIRSRGFVVAGTLMLCLCGATAQAATFTVNTTADNGAGSFREALGFANNTAAEDVIEFALPADSVITVDSNLPSIVQPVIIDALTPRIVLSASVGSTATRGIQIDSGTDTVSIAGLEIANFPVGIIASGIMNLFNTIVRDSVGDGIQLANGTLGVIGREDEFSEGCSIYGNGGNGITFGGGGKMPTLAIRNSRIGVSPAGVLDGNGGAGIDVRGTLSDFEVYIFQNLISANTGAGIRVHDADATRLIIGGNSIGLGADDSPAANVGGGITVENTVGLLIGDAGGDLFGRDPNLIYYNTGFGVSLSGITSGCSIARNGIAGNAGPGVVLASAAQGNIITGNTFQQNTGAGIDVSSDACFGNDFTSNVFDENGGLVTLVADSQGGIQPPVLTAEADRVTAVGLAFGESVEWYFDDGAGTLYSVGFGVSQLYLEDLSELFGGTLRALVTDLDDGTSAFSETIVVEPPAEVLEDGCVDALAYDDDTPAGLVALPEEADLGGFAMLFEPPTPFHVEQVCVNLQSSVDGPFLGAVAVYVNNAGTPGGLIRRVPFGAQLTSTPTRFTIDVSSPRISFDTGSVFVGLLYDQDAYPNVALTADSGEGVTPRPLFRSTDGGGSWDAFGNVSLAFDVIGTRLIGEETGCSSGIVVDDGTFEGSIGPDSIKAGFGISATPPSYPYRFTGTCLRLHAPVQSATLSATLRAFSYDGTFTGEGQPNLGGELAAIPLEAVPLTNAPSWYYFDFGASDVEITQGSVFFRLDWVSTTLNGNNEQLFYNNTNGSESQQAYVRAASDGSFVPMTVLFPTFRSFGWRLDGETFVPEGEGLVEGVTEGITEGVVEGVQEGVVEGVVEGVTEGIAEGVTEGVVEGVVEGNVEGVQEGVVEGVTEGVADGEAEAPAPHAADYNDDFVISLTELLRLVQLYNAANFGCQNGTDDGFAPGGANQSCTPHSADYIEQDWEISLSELLRIVQLYTLGGYVDCGTSEDGFCTI